MEPWSPDIFALEPWGLAYFSPEPWSPKSLWDPDPGNEVALTGIAFFSELLQAAHAHLVNLNGSDGQRNTRGQREFEREFFFLHRPQQQETSEGLSR